MFDTKISDSIITIVRGLHVPEYGHKLNGLLFTLDLNVSDYSKSKKENDRRHVYFLVGGNRSVWFATEDFGPTMWKGIPLNEWVNTSNHDACWSSYGIDRPLTKLYFEMCDRVNPKVASIKLHQHCWFKWTNVQFTWDHDKSDDRHKRKLVDIREV